MVERELAELVKSFEDLVRFHNALRDLLVDLQDLNDGRINALFVKYEVKVTKENKGGKQ